MPPTPYTSQTTVEEACTALAEHICGKRVLITGPTPTSIGGATALALAMLPATHHPSLLFLAGRTPATLETITASIAERAPSLRVRPVVLDLASQKSVRRAAEEVLADTGGVDVIINNAGVMACPYATTEEGVELQFGTNHVGHLLLTNLLIREMLERNGNRGKDGEVVRVVNVSSAGHKRGEVRFGDVGFEDGSVYDKWQAYGQSKTANMLFSVALAGKLGGRGVISVSLYPGRVLSGIARHLVLEEFVKAGWKTEDGKVVDDTKLNWRSLSQAAATLIVAGFEPSIAESNGSYLVNNQIADDQAAAYALSRDNAEKLWALTEELVGEKFDL
ncbi:NAD(P)-binding protein [Aspergillus aculeatinus CBS 121060]|uniref:NAD(P)-binding protein n=1 Tax=Aspergillus aculeatinus CBS 121060 TaxID=1448322 RepID=A0ACD1HDS6_9EURO|nr:NAD(P)-binding protein [Aspergillus aculeatinus CBS 121060]RAH71757.1 NAD(P)-binding protein [Aspergillus aculeatinus CBS 121060]